MSAEGIGDAMSLIEINKPKEGDIKMADVHPNDAEKIESVEHGMPFYFKDLRTNQYLFFRAFITLSTFDSVEVVGGGLVLPFPLPLFVLVLLLSIFLSFIHLIFPLLKKEINTPYGRWLKIQ